MAKTLTTPTAADVAAGIEMAGRMTRTQLVDALKAADAYTGLSRLGVDQLRQSYVALLERLAAEALQAATVKVPARFYDDHVARDLPAGTVVHRTRRHVTVALTDAELAELLSDAEHYATLEGAERDQRGLVLSAQATVDALAASQAPAPAEPAADRDERLRLAKVEHAALRRWIKDGEHPPRPATPNLDAIEAEAKRPAGTSKRAARQASDTTRVTRPTVARDAATVTCVGACGETKEARHFPTVGKDRRGTECRSCRDTRLGRKAA